MNHGNAIAIAMVLTSLTSCAVDELELSESEDAVTTTNKLAANKLAANKLAANKLAANSLSASSLSTATLADTADGREVLTYIASCALDAGTSLAVTRGGTKYTFAGQIGLAPAWATRVPTVTERRWVTACVLARTNLYGIQVQLSLRGSHPKLAATLVEGLQYLLAEGAFYGDLFAPSGPEMYACTSEIRDLDLGLSTQDLRACAMPAKDRATTQCGFTWTGKCAVLDLGLAPACGSLLAPYGKCRGGRAASAARYDEVITVDLATKL